MRADYFQQQIERLRKVYSPGAMSEERAKILWDRFRFVPDDTFGNAITYLISEHTTQSLPAISKFAEAVASFRTGSSAKINEAPQAFGCEPCRDRGWDFIGDTVTACVCRLGQQVNPEDLARYQRQYDSGKKLIPNRDALPAFLKGAQ